ncbi:hypothetical protein [Streptomyces sp. B1I3]|uniref:hypothetical protein n=1 Tax=Streptomyces sp. B1I3 TaxID=3042264 RepID=UPI00278A7ABA|nr:hypothetical protein [Streptomyces sp. B1I3]MDQ0791762.1 hypothetical protein [Streptomyces sp. B1I3]
MLISWPALIGTLIAECACGKNGCGSPVKPASLNWSSWPGEAATITQIPPLKPTQKCMGCAAKEVVGVVALGVHASPVTTTPTSWSKMVAARASSPNTGTHSERVAKLRTVHWWRSRRNDKSYSSS